MDLGLYKKKTQELCEILYRSLYHEVYCNDYIHVHVYTHLYITARACWSSLYLKLKEECREPWQDK